MAGCSACGLLSGHLRFVLANRNIDGQNLVFQQNLLSRFFGFPSFSVSRLGPSRTLAALRPTPNYWGLPLLVGLAAVWLLGNLGEVRVVQEFALVAILVALVWAALGTAVVRAFASLWRFFSFWFPLDRA